MLRPVIRWKDRERQRGREGPSRENAKHVERGSDMRSLSLVTIYDQRTAVVCTVILLGLLSEITVSISVFHFRCCNKETMFSLDQRTGSFSCKTLVRKEKLT